MTFYCLLIATGFFEDWLRNIIILIKYIAIIVVGVIGNHEDLPKEVSARTLDGYEPPIVKGGISVPRGVDNQPPLTPGPPLTTISPMLPTTDMSAIQGRLEVFSINFSIKCNFFQYQERWNHN